MIFKKTQISIHHKDRKDLEYAKDVYKKRIQIEADSFLGQEEYPDKIVAKDILYLDLISF